MPVHGKPAPFIATLPTTLITVHGTAEQVDALVDVIDCEAVVVLGRLPEPCNDDGCYFIEAFVAGHVQADELRAEWLARIAARN